MKAAKRRVIDSLRRGRMLVQKHEEIAPELEWQQQLLANALGTDWTKLSMIGPRRNDRRFSSLRQRLQNPFVAS